MANYKIIDTHAHIYPDKIAQKATNNIGAFYDIPMSGGDGTVKMLLDNGSRAGVSHFVVHSVATTASQVAHINDFIIREVAAHKEFTGLCTLHPDMTSEEIKSELSRAKAAGLKGVKLHPDFQKFNIDDENAFKIYAECDKIGFSILFHAGDNRVTFSKPYRIANVAKYFPKLKIIAAHFGGYRSWDEVDCYIGHDNVFFDTSSALSFLSNTTIYELFDTFGTDRYMFGVDYPMWTHTDEVSRFLQLDLTESERQAILFENASKFYDIK